MKNLIYILGFIFLFACQSSQKKTPLFNDQVKSSKNDHNLKEKSEFDLDGTWGLTNYFDTIIENRALAKYRSQPPVAFALLLEIENDSLTRYGSIERKDYTINKSKDTILNISSSLSNDIWHLIISEPYLKLIQSSKSKASKPTPYIYRRREDFNYFTKVNIDFYVIGENVTRYFSEQLFKGKYINSATQEEVIFGAGGELIGVDGYDSYEVRNYFGTLHMYKNLDVVTFKNEQSKKYKQYHWLFSEDGLTLTEFVYEQFSSNGKTHPGDYLVLGKERIELKKY